MLADSISELPYPHTTIHPQQQIPQTKSQIQPNIKSTHSQHPNPKNINDTQSKCNLLKLMVEVRLEQMGYSHKNVAVFAQKQIAKIITMEEISPGELSQVAFDLVAMFLFEQNVEGLRWGRRLEVRDRAQRSEASRISYQRQRQQQNHADRITLPPSDVLVVRRQPSQSIVCSICYNRTSYYYKQICNHSFCEDCLRGYTRQCISSGTWDISCPQYNCSTFLSLQTIKNLLPNDEHTRFLYFYQKNQNQLNPENKFCSRPDCGEILISKDDNLVCEKCKAQFCEVCLQPTHKGTKCNEALKNALEHTYSAFNIKKCPNCKSPIEKSQGCNHMHCKKCQSQFCWLCLRSCSIYHYKYYNCLGCPGMQFGDEEEISGQRVKQLVLYLLLPVILALLLSFYLISIPLYMLVMYFSKPIEWIGRANSYFQGKFVSCCCECMPEAVQNTILWILFQPRAILYMVFVAPIKITAIECGEICRAFQ